MKTSLPLLLVCLLAASAGAREGGGGGFHGEGFREGPEGGQFRGEEPMRPEDPAARAADPGVRAPDAAAVRTVNGREYDAAAVGPDGFRAGYVWRDGDYAAVELSAGAPYLAPYGDFAGWSVVTQPDYVTYPVYATYPVETAVQVALQNLGLYEGPIDGLSASCAGAIQQYQSQNGMDPTGTITPQLLTALGIQASFP
jgi:hypothetical protein